MRYNQHKRYDIRTQLYGYDYSRLNILAEAENRTVASCVKNLVMEALDSFERTLEDNNAK